MLNKGKGDVKMKGDAKGMVKGRGTLQGGEPR